MENPGPGSRVRVLAWWGRAAALSSQGDPHVERAFSGGDFLRGEFGERRQRKREVIRGFEDVRFVCRGAMVAAPWFVGV